MRFGLVEWALLIVVSGIASAAPSAVSIVGSEQMNFEIALALGALLYMVVDMVAPWLVLRRCVDDLRLTRWLLANALGNALAAVFGHLPFVLLRSRGAGSLWFLDGLDRTQLLTSIAWGAAYYLPPGLLLQRLTGVGAWPFIAAGAISGPIVMSVFPLLWGSIPARSLLASFSEVTGGTGFRASLGFAFGATNALILGAGLFLMTRLHTRSAVAP
jgi:hypothetical protein